MSDSADEPVGGDSGADGEALGHAELKRAPSLLAGLPRPKVASAPSPLSLGLSRPGAVLTPAPSAGEEAPKRSTQMGMPVDLFVGGDEREEPVEEPSPVPGKEPAAGPEDQGIGEGERDKSEPKVSVPPDEAGRGAGPGQLEADGGLPEGLRPHGQSSPVVWVGLILVLAAIAFFALR